MQAGLGASTWTPKSKDAGLLGYYNSLFIVKGEVLDGRFTVGECEWIMKLSTWRERSIMVSGNTDQLMIIT